MAGSWSPHDFPDLQASHYAVTSPLDLGYNCIAWSAGDTAKWWWPDDPALGYGYWPPSIPREPTIEAFVQAYLHLGYRVCNGPKRVRGFEKIALYVDAAKVPTHAARQLPGGSWTSKIGQCEDIEHNMLSCLTGPSYGRPAAYFCRAIAIQPYRVSRWRRLVHQVLHRL